MAVDDKRIAEIRARVEAATPGPWKWDDNGYAEMCGEKCPHGSEWTGHGPDLEAPSVVEKNGGHTFPKLVIGSYGYDAWGLDIVKQDADFVAHARQDIPDLLAALDAARADVARLRESNERLKSMLDIAMEVANHNIHATEAQP